MRTIGRVRDSPRMVDRQIRLRNSRGWPRGNASGTEVADRGFQEIISNLFLFDRTKTDTGG